MKKLFISMLAVAALASCSQEDVIVADKGDLIGFNSFVENSTRATDPSYSANNIQSFKVYGIVNGGQGDVLIYPGTEIKKDGAEYGSPWTCPVDQYWIANADYKFVGIVDGEVAGVTKTNLEKGMPTSVEYTADGKTDLLCQTITRKNDTSIVKFNFSHLLSKVNFTVVNGTPNEDGYSFVVKNINFAGNVAGVYNVANAAWDNSKFTTDNIALGNERTVTVDGVDTKVKDIVVPTDAEKVELGTEVLFLPGTYKITFTVDILYNNKLVTTTNYPAEGTYTQTLEQNKAYNFNVTVSVGDRIQFTATTMPDWNEDVNGDNKVDANDNIKLQ